MATTSTTEQSNGDFRNPHTIEVPAPTVWPFILAFGVTLLFAGLVTSMSVSVLGAALALAGCVGWFRDVFPHQQEEAVAVVPEDIRLTTERPCRGTDSSPAGSTARMASGPHISSFGGG